MPITLFGAVPNDKQPDDEAVRQAINASLEICGGAVFFPPGIWDFNDTVTLNGGPNGGNGIMLQGSSNHNHVQFATPPQTQIHGPRDRPAFVIGGCNASMGGTIHMRDLSIDGGTTAVKVSNAVLVRFTNVGFSAQQVDFNETAGDCAPAWQPVNGRSCASTGCNVKYGSDNAALVIENSFWLWCDFCTFQFGPDYSQARTGYHCNGQRPNVIFRGGTCPTPYPFNKSRPISTGHQPNATYLVRIRNAQFNGGGIQYQHTMAADQTMGQFVLESIVMENAATPFLDLQVPPGLDWKDFIGVADWGLKDVLIKDFRRDDAHRCHWQMDGCIANPNASFPFPTTIPIVAFNCSVPNCTMESVSIEASQNWGGPAVRVYNGDVRSVFIRNAPNSGMSGPGVVVDEHDIPIGAWISDTGGGYTLIGHDTTNSDSTSASKNGGTISSKIVKQSSEQDPAPEHALLLGVSGEANARVAIQSDGSVHYGPGGNESFSGSCTFASMCKAATRSQDVGTQYEDALRWKQFLRTLWDPPSLRPGKRAVTRVQTRGVRPGDICHASHDQVSTVMCKGPSHHTQTSIIVALATLLTLWVCRFLWRWMQYFQ